MDNVRNLVGNPLAGVDPDELVDTRAYCDDFTNKLTNNGTSSLHPPPSPALLCSNTVVGRSSPHADGWCSAVGGGMLTGVVSGWRPTGAARWCLTKGARWWW